MDTTQRPTETKMLSEGQLKASVMGLLLLLAEARQATINESTLKVYAAKLCLYPPEDVRGAVETFTTRPRRDGETAFPALGDLVDMVQVQKRERMRQRDNRIIYEALEGFFWEHINFLKSSRGWSEQQALDSIQTPGWTGRRARPDSVQRSEERREYQIYLQQSEIHQKLFPWKAQIPA